MLTQSSLLDCSPDKALSDKFAYDRWPVIVDSAVRGSLLRNVSRIEHSDGFEGGGEWYGYTACNGEAYSRSDDKNVDLKRYRTLDEFLRGDGCCYGYGYW